MRLGTFKAQMEYVSPGAIRLGQSGPERTPEMHIHLSVPSLMTLKAKLLSNRGESKDFKRWLSKFRQLRRKIKIKTWVLILILIPLLLLDAFLLRQDHIKMTELRDWVLVLDEASETTENAAEITEALDELRNFVNSHIVVNVVEENGESKIEYGTGPFYLEHQYLRAANRALEEAKEKLASDANPNGNIYSEAGAKCSALAIQNGWGWNNPNYINCMLDEIRKYPAANELQDEVIAALPSTELYRREYAGPVFAWCLSGICILITAILAIVIIIRFLVWLFLRIAINFA